MDGNRYQRRSRAPVQDCPQPETPIRTRGYVAPPWQDPPTQWPQAPTCATCRHFTRDPPNPAAGAGNCQLGLGVHYPNERHWCRSHTTP